MSGEMHHWYITALVMKVVGVLWVKVEAVGRRGVPASNMLHH